MRGGYYVSAKVPATISTVHASNCALAHVKAAERAHLPDVGGRAFFVRDFESNVVAMAIEAFGHVPAIRPTLIPLRLAYALAWVLDAIDRLLHAAYALFGARRSTPEDVIDIRAVAMAWISIVVSDRRARSVLGYEPTVSREQCMREAGEWAAQFYAKIS